MEIIFKILWILFIIFLSFPILILGTFISLSKPDKRTKQSSQEKQKKYFYNLWLPIIIYIILFYLWRFPYYLDELKYCSSFVNCTGYTLISIIADGMKSNIFFWMFYPLYHLCYFSFTWFISAKYCGGKISWIIFLISFVIAFLYAWIYSFLSAWEVFSATQESIEYVLYSKEERSEREALEQERKEEEKKYQYEAYQVNKERCLENIKHLELPEETSLELCDKYYKKGK